jgi:hypothetical protein
VAGRAPQTESDRRKSGHRPVPISASRFPRPETRAKADRAAAVSFSSGFGVRGVRAFHPAVSAAPWPPNPPPRRWPGRRLPRRGVPFVTDPEPLQGGITSCSPARRRVRAPGDSRRNLRSDSRSGRSRVNTRIRESCAGAGDDGCDAEGVTTQKGSPEGVSRSAAGSQTRKQGTGGLFSAADAPRSCGGGSPSSRGRQCFVPGLPASAVARAFRSLRRAVVSLSRPSPALSTRGGRGSNGSPVRSAVPARPAAGRTPAGRPQFGTAWPSPPRHASPGSPLPSSAPSAA